MSNDKKQNILIVHNYYQIPGGEDTVVANEKKMLEDHGHKVILYSRNNAELKQMSKLQKLVLPITTIFNPRTYKEIKRLIKLENIEIVHVHNTLNLVSPAVYYAARAMKVPVVQTVHNFRLLCPGATLYRDGHICEDCLERGLWCAVKHKCYRGSRIQTLACVLSTWFHRITGIYGKINYICLTEFNKSKLLELKQIKPEKVFVKPNFVESKGGFVSGENRKNQFVFAGRLDKLKGIDILFEAWKRMGDTAPELVVCGTGSMEEWCKSFVQQNRVNVELRGFVSNDEVLEIIANSRALVLPTQLYEGFPMNIVEAFCVGTPVICSDLGNAGNVVEDGINGVKFQCDSPSALIQAVRRFEQMDRKMLGENAFQKYKMCYEQDGNCKMMDNVYTRISSGGGYRVKRCISCYNAESEYNFVPEEKRKNQFAFVGRLDKLKGIDILFEAWKKMGDTAPKLIVCGTGPMEEWCNSFVQKNRVNIEMRGFVPNTEARKLIANSKALVLPTQWYEGFPMSIVEAFSVGTPVVCSDLGNTGSIVEEGITGRKFRPDSADSLILAINQCKGLNESTLREYQIKYTSEKNYKTLIDIYAKTERNK
ncbi:MAG: glycosyltransferase [Eubacteriales bacterium]|nr:glycosyltransferase [Eubacteriales bacterium]